MLLSLLQVIVFDATVSTFVTNLSDSVSVADKPKQKSALLDAITEKYSNNQWNDLLRKNGVEINA